MPTPPDLKPRDRHDSELLANVHPPGWVNPTPAGRYNLVVVGAGTAGLVSAAGAAGLGARVALVERHLMGGDCLNVGCVPSKTLLRAARAAADVRDAERFGVRLAAPPTVDFAAVMERVRQVRAGISPHDSARRFTDEYGVDVFLGDGRFTGPDTLAVDGATLRFERAVIATGARAAAPPIPGLAEAGYLTNETVFELTELPPRLAVLGGGPIGCELAQAFARLGSAVTVIEQHHQLLPREDAPAAAVLRAALDRDGVTLRLGARVTAVECDQDGRRLVVEGPAGPATVAADAILVAAGRRPNTEGLGLEAAGVGLGEHGVAVDDHLRTANRRIYAAGDVCSPYRFTHAADFMARTVIQNAFFGPLGRARASALTIPWCTYTDPEIAHVGLSQREAAARGREITTFRVPLAEVDRAVADGEGEGFVAVHVRHGSDQILGATVVARHAGEMIAELTAAVGRGIGLGALAKVIHPYPTQAEAVRRAGDLYNRTRLTPLRARLLRRYFAWRRR